MDNVTKLLGFLQAPNLFRDVVIALSGVGSGLFFQFVLHVNILSKFEALNIGRIETDFAMLVGAYIFARLLRILTEIIFLVLSPFFWFTKSIILNPQPIKEQWNTLKQNLQTPTYINNIRTFFDLDGFPNVSAAEMEGHISAMEMADAITRYPSLGADIERTIYYLIVAEIAFATSLIAAIFFNHYYFIPSILLLYSLYSAIKINKNSEYEIYRAVVKDLPKQAAKAL